MLRSWKNLGVIEELMVDHIFDCVPAAPARGRGKDSNAIDGSHAGHGDIDLPVREALLPIEDEGHSLQCLALRLE